MLTISFRRPVFPASFEAINNSNRSHKAFGSLERKTPCPKAPGLHAFICSRFAFCFGIFTRLSQIGFMIFFHL